MQTVTKRNTVLVRNIMQKYNTFSIYTNKYKKCKTVKCNFSRNATAVEISAMCDEIAATLQSANYAFTIKQFASKTWHRAQVAIVRFAN